MLRKTSSGIGFIEVMTAVVIISIAALGILMGAVHAWGELQDWDSEFLGNNLVFLKKI